MKSQKIKKAVQVCSVIFGTASLLFAVFVLSAIGVGMFSGKMSENLLPAACSSIATAILAFGLELIAIKENNRRMLDQLDNIFSSVESINQDLNQDISHIDMDKVLLTRDRLVQIQTREPGNIFLNAKRIDMSGMSLRGNVINNYASFQQMLRNGGTCHFALVSPDGQSPAIIAQRYDKRQAASKYIGEINQTLSRLDALRKEFPNQVHITIADHIPSTSITIIDRDSEERKCYVEIYTYNVHEKDKSIQRFNVSRPHIYLSNENSKYWISFFQAQFDEIRRIGKPYEGKP